MKGIYERAIKELENTRTAMSRYYDQHRLPQPKYEVDTQVMLNAKNIRSRRPTRKLAPKLYGPFRVVKKIGTRSYQLELQERWSIYNMFHSSQLEPYRVNPFEQRAVNRPALEKVDGELE
jgi:hypothetical protein